MVEFRRMLAKMETAGWGAFDRGRRLEDDDGEAGVLKESIGHLCNPCVH